MLGSDFSQQDIFKKVSEMVFRLTPADRFLVLLRDADGEELQTVATEFRIRMVLRREDRLPSARRSSIGLWRTCVAALIDTQSDERFAAAKSIVMQNISSVMCAPLLAKDGVLGVIYVDCAKR